jgi:hypothetical protein
MKTNEIPEQSRLILSQSQLNKLKAYYERIIGKEINEADLMQWVIDEGQERESIDDFVSDCIDSQYEYENPECPPKYISHI